MTAPPAIGADAAAWIRTHVWPRELRRDHRSVPGAFERCPCQWGPCGHCAADRHDQCTHERHPEAAGQPTPEDWLTTPPGSRYAIYVAVWLADRACAWTCPCASTHTRQPAQPEQLALI